MVDFEAHALRPHGAQPRPDRQRLGVAEVVGREGLGVRRVSLELARRVRLVGVAFEVRAADDDELAARNKVRRLGRRGQRPALGRDDGAEPAQLLLFVRRPRRRRRHEALGPHGGSRVPRDDALARDRRERVVSRDIRPAEARAVDDGVAAEGLGGLGEVLDLDAEREFAAVGSDVALEPAQVLGAIHHDRLELPRRLIPRRGRHARRRRGLERRLERLPPVDAPHFAAFDGAAPERQLGRFARVEEVEGRHLFDEWILCSAQILVERHTRPSRARRLGRQAAVEQHPVPARAARRRVFASGEGADDDVDAALLERAGRREADDAAADDEDVAARG
mmetsp:Transcript_15143/g.60814  ORF Transcript_15143/g.60814 Transcript_15143/m.60814 type:complete len:336 (+) Transcript_15143:1179-2186(+)